AAADRTGDRARDRDRDRTRRRRPHQAAHLALPFRARSLRGRAARRLGVRLDDAIARREGGHSRLPREAPGALGHAGLDRRPRPRAVPQEEMAETLGAFLDDVTAREPDREAVGHAPRDRVTARMSRAALRAASRTAAKKLVQLGVGKGTRVGFLCPNRLEWLPIAFGALRIGAVLVPFSTLWKREEIAYALAHGDVQLLVTVSGFLKHDSLASLADIVPG